MWSALKVTVGRMKLKLEEKLLGEKQENKCTSKKVVTIWNVSVIKVLCFDETKWCLQLWCEILSLCPDGKMKGLFVWARVSIKAFLQCRQICVTSSQHHSVFAYRLHVLILADFMQSSQWFMCVSDSFITGVIIMNPWKVKNGLTNTLLNKNSK